MMNIRTLTSKQSQRRKVISAILAGSLLLIAQLPANAARRNLKGGMATIKCIRYPNGTKVFWIVVVSDVDKPMLYYNFNVKVAGGEVSEDFSGTGSFTSISKVAFFPGYQKANVSATLEGFAGGANSNAIYVYRVSPPLPTECIPAYEQ